MSAINTQFGAYYFKYWLDRLERMPALAAAAYNAGPGRAQAWRAGAPLEGAIWVETIPFNETRDYVKKVLANAMVYARALDQAYRAAHATAWARCLPAATGPAWVSPPAIDERPPRSLRSLPPAGARSALRAAGRADERPPRSLRSLPPGGRSVPFGRPGGH